MNENVPRKIPVKSELFFSNRRMVIRRLRENGEGTVFLEKMITLFKKTVQRNFLGTIALREFLFFAGLIKAES
jgi:hypothetical protein